MDSTELHYVQYDPEAIWESMMTAYLEAGGEIIYPGDEKYMLLKGALSVIVQTLGSVDNALRMQTLRYAVSDYLDLLGENRNCERLDAAEAKATVTITTNATGIAETLAAGTGMTADGSVFYLLEEDIALTGAAQTITASVICDRKGSVGNGLTAGTQMQMQNPNPAVNSIVAATSATGGQDREKDDVYRERIRAHGLSSVSTGPAQQYEAAAKAVSSVIVDANAVKIGDGSVGVYLILSTQEGAAALLQAVTDALNGEETRPLTDSVTVAQATDVTYTLNVEYTCDNSNTTHAAIAEAAEEYQAWQDNTIGLAFNPDKLMALMYQAGATRVVWGSGSTFNGGTVEYTTIDDDERCKGTITLTAAT